MPLIGMKKPHPLLFLGAMFVAAFLYERSGFAENHAPVLAPPMNGMDEVEEDYVPNTISFQEARRAAAKRLPASRESSSRTVGFDMPSAPSRGTVIPQNFLEDEVDSSIPKPVAQPKSLKKTTPKPLIEADNEAMIQEGDIIYEEDIVLPGSRRRFLVADSTGAAVNGTPPTMAPRPESESSSQNVQEFGGVYTDCSPAWNYGYSTCPVVKPFGTGMLDNLTFFGGVTGFRGELDGPEKGNFGVMEGFNWSGPATPQCTVSAQFGLRAVQSNLYGSTMNDDFDYRKSIRSQYFVTAGVFKRDLCQTVQVGAAYDWCFDDFYGKITLQQIRVEAALRTFSNLEYGFQGAFGTTKERNDWISWQAGDVPPFSGESYYMAQNCFLLFGRKHFCNGGLAEVRIGATDYGDLIVGGLGEFPLSDRLTVNGAFSMLCPKEGNNVNGWRRETWEISVGMVYYFRGGACSKPCNPCRPMFEVANNGSFFGRLFR